MEKKLNFYRNYNGKLWLNYFTTIRDIECIDEKELKEGDIVHIQVDHLTLFHAVIIKIEKIDINNLSESQKTILIIDAGCNWKSARTGLANIYKDKELALITLAKIK